MFAWFHFLIIGIGIKVCHNKRQDDSQILAENLFRFAFVYVGLNIEVDRILEIACVITNGTLTKSIEVRSGLLLRTCSVVLFADDLNSYIVCFSENIVFSI